MLDVHHAQRKKGKKGLVHGNLCNNIYQYSVITGVVVVNDNKKNNDAATDKVLYSNNDGVDTQHTGVPGKNVLHVNNDGVEAQCTGVPGNDGVETQHTGVPGNMEVNALDDDTPSIGVGSADIHSDRNESQVTSPDIDQYQLYAHNTKAHVNDASATAKANMKAHNTKAHVNDASANTRANAANGSADAKANANTKRHLGLYATQGRGAMINVNSSTETEVVSTGEHIHKCTWFQYSCLAQDDNKIEEVLVQDNKSYILLANNCPLSTDKGSKHNSLHYFL